MVSHPCDRKKSQGWGTGYLWAFQDPVPAIFMKTLW
jgi:hypothetical protein